MLERKERLKEEFPFRLAVYEKVVRLKFLHVLNKFEVYNNLVGVFSSQNQRQAQSNHYLGDLGYF